MWQKTKFINENTENSGNWSRRTFDARLLQGTNEGGKGRGEGKTAGGFPPSHNALYPTPPSPPAGPAPVCPTSVPLRGSLPAVHLREQPQPGCKCAELFWQRFRINGKPFLWLLSIVVLIKLNSCGAHMDVICKSHCSLQIKADGEISLLFLSHSSELWWIYSINEILITVDMREYQSWWHPWEVLVILVNLWRRCSGTRLKQTYFHVQPQPSNPHLKTEPLTSISNCSSLSVSISEQEVFQASAGLQQWPVSPFRRHKKPPNSSSGTVSKSFLPHF